MGHSPLLRKHLTFIFSFLQSELLLWVTAHTWFHPFHGLYLKLLSFSKLSRLINHTIKLPTLVMSGWAFSVKLQNKRVSCLFNQQHLKQWFTPRSVPLRVYIVWMQLERKILILLWIFCSARLQTRDEKCVEGLSVFIPVQKSLSAVTTSVVRQFCS